MSSMTCLFFSSALLLLVSISVSDGAAPAPIQQRVSALLSQMTLTEKLYQLASYTNTKNINSYAHGIGRMPSPGGDPAAIVKNRNSNQQTVMNGSRLNIPASFHSEALHSCCDGGTVFPMPVMQGCTWNNTLVAEMAGIIAREARVVGIDILYSPVINMWTDPRFGRLSEGFSENPTLSSFYARAAVEGFQHNGDGPYSYLDASHAISLAKHFAAYGAAAGGLNAAPADISARTMFEIFLKPWRAFAGAGGRGAMASHQTWNRVPMHANAYAINEVFREQFGFGDGQMVSDCDDIGVLQDYRIAANKSQAGARGLLGGVDLDLICANPTSSNLAGAYLQLQSAITSGWIHESDVDQAVTRVLAGKFAVGLFDNQTYVTDTNAWKTVLNNAEHQNVAYQAALQGTTLLQARNGLSSLKSLYDSGQLKKLAIIGPNADCNNSPSNNLCDTQLNMLGPYTQEDNQIQVLTVMQAFQQSAKYNKALTITHAEGVAVQSWNTGKIPAAVTMATASDAVILVLGDNAQTCGEWVDRQSLDPPGVQLQLLESVASALNGTQIPLVVVLIHGRTMTFGGSYENPVLADIDIVLSAWRCGEMCGPALRDIIMGDAENSGRLGQNWPKTVGHVNSGSSPWLQAIRGKWVSNSRSKADPDGRMYDSYEDEKAMYGQITDPLFALGFGLSNTGCAPFAYSNLKVTVVNNKATQTDDSTVISVTVDVTNNCQSGMFATDVIQIYLVDPPMLNMDINAPILVRYWKRLIGYEKVRVNGKQTQTVSANIRFDDIAIYVDSDFKQFELVAGKYTVRVGSSSRTDTLHTTVDL